MTIVEQASPARYARGVGAPDDTGRTPPAYTPPPEGMPAEAAAEPWTAEDRAEWLAAKMADASRESEGGW